MRNILEKILYYKNLNVFVFCIFFIYFLNYTFDQIFNEDFIIIICFFSTFFLIKKNIENVVTQELDNRIDLIKNQFLQILKIKEIFLNLNLVYYKNNISIIFIDILKYIYYLYSVFMFISLEKLEDLAIYCNLNFLDIITSNNILELTFLKNKTLNLINNV